ncbi:hypothetical protein ACSXC4_01835 [Clostridium perfringens]|uniref:Uncharacterized protein n=1 Tax=Clostridium perfringens TaxID=1502 RepID=A0A0N7BV77_CLOPF|nr:MULTISPECIES: hypothetical protein [Clostridium]AKF16578.1 hypothetical protein [Clostridium perfringens]AMN35160.1 hypothetical protein JFP838_05130 [Clostridium perfringens]EIL8447036.1 hypothetical protein [Clostridium perfringens]ELC8392664.1 hypothetical protein [Clostridium perfringens]MBO3421698.1 hypothetical protein [Clostridium perfringens]
MENLWGDFKPTLINTPNSILDTSIKQLKTISNNFIYAELAQSHGNEIVNITSGRFYKFNFAFLIKSKYLENYSFKAFSIHYDLISYPLQLKIDETIKKSIRSQIMSLGKDPNQSQITISNENEFIAILKFILQSEKMKEIINTLYSISKENLTF